MEQYLEESYPLQSGKIINDSTSIVIPTPIQEFYKNTSIFLTGGTGFLGKILIEKLLRSCPGIRTIYVLVRDKRGKSANDRIRELLVDSIFDLVRRDVSDCENRLIPVPGDCSLPGLGLAAKDIKTLQAEVEIVFHVAATVRFDEKLKLAIAINVNSVRDVMNLCRNMSKLKSVIHVSTAYSQCYLQEIEEKLYELPFDYEKLSAMLEKMDDRAIEEQMPNLLGCWPNTYSLTKAMAESYIKDSHGSLPLGVFRPAIVVSTYREPIKGWIDNYYGPTGVCAAAMMGVLRTMHCRGEVNANMVPVDMCVNALISSAWDVATNWDHNNPPPVYNYVSSVEKPITWCEYNSINIVYRERYPIQRVLGNVDMRANRSIWVHRFYMLILHLIPALIADALGILVGRKPRLTQIIVKMHKFSNVISHFATREWSFKNQNVRQLVDRLTNEDAKLFDFDMRKLDWLEYFRTYVLGIRFYLFKECPSTIPTARKRYFRLTICLTLMKILMCYLAIYTLWTCLISVCSFTFALLSLLV